ncbi:MAG: hypothetical protein KC619_18570 [Myxococcales bacterium]|nr:hypothetical protein [Myxococcales bacterium]
MRVSAAVLAVILAGCSPGMAPDAGSPMDAAAPVDANRPDAQADVEGTGEWTLVIRYVHFPELPPSGSREVPGMDLDGHVTASTRDPIGCYFEDWVAPAAYVDTEGIDNQSPNILTAVSALNPMADLNGDVMRSVGDGGATHVMRITRIGDAIDDGEVDVAVFRVEPTAPLVYETVVVDGTPRELLAPGQTFRVHPESLIEGRPRTELPNASLRGGRLFTPPGHFSLRIPSSSGGVTHLELHGLHIGGRVSAERLEHGLMAGYVRVEDVPATIESLNLDRPVDPMTIDSITEQIADLDTDGDGTCEAVSMGVAIEGVAATLVFP